MLDWLLAVPRQWRATPWSALGLIPRRDHSISPATTRQIVVSKLVGTGSIIQATLFLQAIKQQFPQARLTLECSRGLAERIEDLNEMLCSARHAAVTHPSYPAPPKPRSSSRSSLSRPFD